jgi:hypothetical protein
MPRNRFLSIDGNSGRIYQLHAKFTEEWNHSNNSATRQVNPGSTSPPEISAGS